MFYIALPNDLAVGAVFSTVELATEAANRMGLTKFEVKEQFTSSLETEAREVIQDMWDTAVRDVVRLQQRIADLKVDYKIDPYPLTESEIKRLEERLVKRDREAHALSMALSKF